jgi:hypothetical protein
MPKGAVKRTTKMRIPTWVMVIASVLAALPFGWGLGVVASYLIAGNDFGQLPAITVPLCIIAAIAFALSPLLTPRKRLAFLVIGAGLFMLLGL